LPACTPGEVIRYEAGEPLTELPQHPTVAEARAIVADVCDAIAACHPVVVGPFDRELVWRRANNRALLFAAGLARRAYSHDRNMRGAMLTSRHYRISPEEITANNIVSPATDVYFAAYFLVELITGAEPFPTGETFAYLNAVKHGHPEIPPGLPPEVTRAFDLDPTARPSAAELATALRSEPAPPRRRSWWSRLFGR
jgi:serine/threonine-protein kinase